MGMVFPRKQFSRLVEVASMTVGLGLFLSGPAVLLAGCPTAAKVTCQIIKVADDACTTFDLVGADGGHQQVPVTPQELQGFAREVGARRAMEREAGVGIGAPLPDAGK